MLQRWLTSTSVGNIQEISKVFEIIGMAKVAKSAHEAKELRYLKSEDSITMNRDRLLSDAKAKALSLVADYQPPKSCDFSMPGASARVSLSLAVKALVKNGKASAYDEEVCQQLAFILTGGDTDIIDKVSEDQLYALEHAAFMHLIRSPKTWARIEHMLDTGKPLRN